MNYVSVKFLGSAASSSAVPLSSQCNPARREQYFMMAGGGGLIFLSNLIFHPPRPPRPPRSRPSRTCPSCPGRTPLFTPKCSRRSVCLCQSRPARPPVSSPFRSLTSGSSSPTHPLGEATMSTASPRRGPGSLLDGPEDEPSTR